MTVERAIQILQQYPMQMKLMLDMSTEQSEMFHLVSVDDMDVVETEQGEKYILITAKESLINKEINYN